MTLIFVVGQFAIFIPVTKASDLDTGVRISHILAGESSSTSSEFIALFNNSDSDIDVTGYCLRMVDELNDFICVNADAGKRVYIKARDYLTITSQKFFDLHEDYAADTIYPTGKLAVGTDGIILRDATAKAIDTVQWGVDDPGIPTGTMAQRNSVDGLGIELIDMDTMNLADFRAVLPPLTFPLNNSYELMIPPVECAESCEEDVDAVNECTGIVLNEIGANIEEQYIEVHNPTDEVIEIAGCKLQTNRSSKTFTFLEESLAAGQYLTIAVSETELTLTKTTTGTVYLLSSDEMTELDVQTYSNLNEDTSWSRFEDGWFQTYALTPGEENVDQEYPPCDQGYFRNTETGRCNQIPVEEELTPCDVGQYRSTETNRCRNLTLPSSLKPCRADQYRNQDTNRCRNLASASSDLKPCKENQYRSEETNRCRNKAGDTLPEAAFKVQPVDNADEAFAGWLALGGVGVVAGGYAGWEWRRELAGGWSRFVGIFKK